MIDKPNLEVKHGFEVGAAHYADEPTTIIDTMSAPTTNPGANTLDTTASGENLSKKFKNPSVHQDPVPAP